MATTYRVTGKTITPDVAHPLAVRLAGALGIDAAQVLYITVVEAEDQCPKCSGTGTVHAYKHVNDGVCYRCDGTGIMRDYHVYDVEYAASVADADAIRNRTTPVAGQSFLAGLLAGVGTVPATTVARRVR